MMNNTESWFSRLRRVEKIQTAPAPVEEKPFRWGKTYRQVINTLRGDVLTPDMVGLFAHIDADVVGVESIKDGLELHTKGREIIRLSVSSRRQAGELHSQREKPDIYKAMTWPYGNPGKMGLDR